MINSITNRFKLRSGVVESTNETAVDVLGDLERMYAAVLAELGGLSSEEQDLAIKLLNSVKAENARVEAFQREHHEYLLANKPDVTEAEFGEYIAPIAFVFGRIGAPSSQAQLEGFEARIEAELPEKLKRFYTAIGGVRVSYGDETLVLNIPSPSERLNEPTRYHKGVGLFDQINNCWGGEREDLSLEQGFDAGLRDQLNKIRCIGWFGDGYCEAHGFIVEKSPDQYGVFYWHQDNELGMPDFNSINAMPLLALLIAALDVYANALLAAGQDIDELEFDLDELVTILNTTLN